MNFRQFIISLSVALGFFSLSACSSSPSDDEGGFYTWVDAQGNVVTVQRDKPDASTGKTRTAAQSAPVAEQQSGQAEASRSDPAVPTSSGEDIVTADNPIALWQAGDDAYISEAEIAARLEMRERERFVSYPDEEGRVVTHALDMKAVKAAGANRDPGYETLAPDAEAFAEGTVQLKADCCTVALDQAMAMVAGEEYRLVFTGRGLAVVDVDGRRPAMVFRLVPGVERIEVQTWLREQGYLHPRLLFLDKAGKPLLLIEYPFSRRYPESFFVWPSLYGDIPVPAQAVSVAVYLPYAGVEDGRVYISGETFQGREPGMIPRLQGDAVIRAR